MAATKTIWVELIEADNQRVKIDADKFDPKLYRRIEPAAPKKIVKPVEDDEKTKK